MKLRAAILGASGYTGAELLRFLIHHPNVEIVTLTGESKAGMTMGDVFAHLSFYNLPKLIKTDDVDWSALDIVFCALPHATTQRVIHAAFKSNPSLRIIDLSADFRLRDVSAYSKWYGHDHFAPDLQAEAVYGLTEHYRHDIQRARLVANPGCYTTASILPLLPLLKGELIETDNIIIDAKSGATGVGRAAKEASLFTEVSEGFHAYGVGHHRHMAELDQEFSIAARHDVTVSFTPHLLPINRGILATIYIKLKAGYTSEQGYDHLQKAYDGEDFVKMLPFGQLPATRAVRGSNLCAIGMTKDRHDNRLILVSVLDNLVKGAAGQAIQNMNVMFGFDETTGLALVPMFP